MARPLRIEYAGASYHVMNRGNRRADVFLSPSDYELFLLRLGRFAEDFAVRVHCYCCMPNHFHLYLTTEQANLSRFMQSFLTSFTVSMNRIRKAPGHLFQGRFRAHLVEDGAYRSEVSRYIHLNPSRVQHLRHASPAEKQEALVMHAWSSYPACVGLRQAPAWLDIGLVLKPWGEDRAAAMAAYRRYVEEGLVRAPPSPFAKAAGQAILGSEPFVDRIRRRFLLARQADRREEPALTKLTQRKVSLGELAEAVGDVFGVAPQDLFSRQGGHRAGRRALMYLAGRYCRSGRSLSDLAGEFGVSVSALSAARSRFARAAEEDPALHDALARIESRLG